MRYNSQRLRMLLAERYAQIRDSARVRERTLFPPQRIPSELELQARWFAGDFGKHFDATTGDKIDIVQFGTWNREAGPDFRDAAIRVNGSEPTAAASSLMLLIAVGKHMVTPPIRHLKRRCCTFSSRRATANFSRAQNRIVMCRKFASIPQFCRTRLAQISRSRDPGVVSHL